MRCISFIPLRVLFVLLLAGVGQILIGCRPEGANDDESRSSKRTLRGDEDPIAIVLNRLVFMKDIHADETDKTALRDCRAIAPPIIEPLRAKFIRQYRLNASPQEIKEFRTWYGNIEPMEKPTPEEEHESDEVAKVSIEQWKFNKALYDKYGGRVVFQQAGSEPLDAYRDWLRDEEKSGSFQVCDPRWRDAFWEYYQPKYHQNFFSDEPDPFKVPPWKKARESKRRRGGSCGQSLKSEWLCPAAVPFAWGYV